MCILSGGVHGNLGHSGFSEFLYACRAVWIGNVYRKAKVKSYRYVNRDGNVPTGFGECLSR
jgi:hypothetical protein